MLVNGLLIGEKKNIFQADANLTLERDREKPSCFSKTSFNGAF
jgi:hypothetical protein